MAKEMDQNEPYMKVNVFGVDEALRQVNALTKSVEELAHEIKILTSHLHEASNVAERAKAILATDKDGEVA